MIFLQPRHFWCSMKPYCCMSATQRQCHIPCGTIQSHHTPIIPYSLAVIQSETSYSASLITRHAVRIFWQYNVSIDRMTLLYLVPGSRWICTSQGQAFVYSCICLASHYRMLILGIHINPGILTHGHKFSCLFQLYTFSLQNLYELHWYDKL